MVVMVCGLEVVVREVETKRWEVAVEGGGGWCRVIGGWGGKGARC